MTYNLLAPDYISEGMYPRCNPKYLNYEYRQPIIIRYYFNNEYFITYTETERFLKLIQTYFASKKCNK